MRQTFPIVMIDFGWFLGLLTDERAETNCGSSTIQNVP